MSNVSKVTYYGDKFLHIPGFNPAKMLTDAFYIVSVDAVNRKVNSYLLTGINNIKDADYIYLNQVSSGAMGGESNGVPNYIQGKLSLIQADGKGGYKNLAFTNLKNALELLH